MRKSTLTRLDAEFAKHPVLAAGAPSESDLIQLEKTAGFSLPSDYKQFVASYGGAIVGPYSIYGIGASGVMGEDEASVLEVTTRFRDQKWPGVEGVLVISTDHAGNPITLNQEGHVYRYDHDSGTTQKLADDFEGYLLNFCLKHEK